MNRAAVWLVAALATSAAASVPADERAIVHVLSRTTFGVRPGDVERVRSMGLQRYVDEQIHPERIPDAAMSARLSGLPTITMTTRHIVEQYELPQIEARLERRAAATEAGPSDAGRPPDAMQRRGKQLVLQLSQQKLLRATYSDRQLQEVLTDFWFNHFNVDARKGRDRFMLTEYERDVIRPHVFGTFRDLLGATAKSPAMLFYLDNWMSADPDGAHAMDRQLRFVRKQFGPITSGRPSQVPQPARNTPRGLNENYGRELLELHTLGVDAGYTQKDVTEVARAFTGWTIENPRQ